MSLDPHTLLAIACMAAVTYLTRIGGWLMVRRVTISGRALGALEAVPGAVLTAVIAPMAIATGPAETIAAAIVVAASLKLPRLVVLVLGVGAVVALRAAFG